MIEAIEKSRLSMEKRRQSEQNEMKKDVKKLRQLKRRRVPPSVSKKEESGLNSEEIRRIREFITRDLY